MLQAAPAGAARTLKGGCAARSLVREQALRLTHRGLRLRITLLQLVCTPGDAAVATRGKNPKGWHGLRPSLHE